MKMVPLPQKHRLVYKIYTYISYIYLKTLILPGLIEQSLVQVSIFCKLTNNFHVPVVIQMGKDIVSFLSWAAEPEMEERKLVNLHRTKSGVGLCYSCLSFPISDVFFP